MVSRQFTNYSKIEGEYVFSGYIFYIEGEKEKASHILTEVLIKKLKNEINTLTNILSTTNNCKTK